MEPSQRVDAASGDEARRLLHVCCGSSRWVERMLARRPFRSTDAMLAAAREEWFALAPSEWREAFSHHPRIGDRESLRRKFTATRHLSAREQAGVDAAPEDVLAALEAGNREYEARFGYVFIVCATGRSAGEMLAMLGARLANEPDEEIRIAAEEHAKITQLRLLALAEKNP
jgi:2-oxo-4-hydroxy-4-carboxy-5-ureidoimidazoline decarboxylase